MASVQVLSVIQELPETGFYAPVTSRKNTFFPKKKLSRLYGMDSRSKSKFILPPSLCAEKSAEKHNKENKKKDFVIPKIVVEEVHFEDDLVFDLLDQNI